MSVSGEFCVVKERTLSRADHSFRGVQPSVCECDRAASIMRTPRPTGATAP